VLDLCAVSLIGVWQSGLRKADGRLLLFFFPLIAEGSVKEASKVTWIGIWLNLALSGAKGAGGVMFNSSSLLADAGHSFSDLLSDFVTLATVKIARKVDQYHVISFTFSLLFLATTRC